MTEMSMQDKNDNLLTHDSLALQIFLDLTAILVEWAVTQFSNFFSIGF